VSLLDVEDLADVAIGVGPDHFVAPGLLDALHAAHDGVRRARSQLPEELPSVG
jgi:hypothetical protein